MQTEEYDLPLDLKYDPSRQFYLRVGVANLEDRPLPSVFTNVFRKRNMIECQTLELMKRNQKVHLPIGNRS
jgi:DNA mismatch repair protein MSH4